MSAGPGSGFPPAELGSWNHFLSKNERQECLRDSVQVTLSAHLVHPVTLTVQLAYQRLLFCMENFIFRIQFSGLSVHLLNNVSWRPGDEKVTTQGHSLVYQQILDSGDLRDTG